MRRLVASTVAGSVLLLVAGCSSDNSSSPSPTASTQSTGSSSPSTAPVSLVVTLPEISGDGPPRPEELDPPTGPTVCRLLSTDEVATVIGAAVAGSEEGGEIRDQIGCQFLDDSADPVFRLTATGPGHSPTPAELLEEALAEPSAEAHPEIGDGGAVTDEGVTMLVGDRLFTLRVLAEDLVVEPEQLLALAALVSTRA